jgi:Flp pilus assembly protein TadB
LPIKETANIVPSHVGRMDKESQMLLAIAAILLVLWLLGFLVIHIGGALIHILVVIAVIVVILHFVRARGPRV